jgi:hypothetical protein
MSAHTGAVCGRCRHVGAVACQCVAIIDIVDGGAIDRPPLGSLTSPPGGGVARRFRKSCSPSPQFRAFQICGRAGHTRSRAALRAAGEAEACGTLRRTESRREGRPRRRLRGERGGNSGHSQS